MNRIALIMLVMAQLPPTLCNAQSIESWGFKAGLTSSAEQLDYATPPVIPHSFERRVGFMLGAFAEWSIVAPISVVTEVEYRQAGSLQQAVYEYNATAARWVFLNDRVDYISIPILMKVAIPDGPLRPYIFAGPRIDFQVGFHRSPLFDIPTDFPPYEDYRKVLLGGTVGAGVELKDLLPFAVLAELSYHPEISDSYKDNYLTVHGNAYGLSLGVQL